MTKLKPTTLITVALTLLTSLSTVSAQSSNIVTNNQETTVHASGTETTIKEKASTQLRGVTGTEANLTAHVDDPDEGETRCNLTVAEEIVSYKEYKILEKRCEDLEGKLAEVKPREIVKDARDFYKDSFDTLLWLIGLMGAIVGVIVPSAFTIHQRFVVKKDEERLKKQIEDNFQVALEGNTKKLQDEYNKLHDKIIQKSQYYSRACALQLKAIELKLKGELNSALRLFTTSCKLMISADALDKARPVLSSIEELLTKVDDKNTVKIGKIIEVIESKEGVNASCLDAKDNTKQEIMTLVQKIKEHIEYQQKGN